MANFAGGPIPFAGVPVAGPGGNGQGFVNVGLPQQLGSNLSQQSGINLSSGVNVLQSQLTPLISAGSSNQLNDTVLNTVGSLGGASSLTSLLPVGAFLGGGIGGLLGGGGAGGGQNKIWPGGGGNGPADYGGFMHNLGPNGSDVVFSIVPANNGPQTAGLDSALSNPTVPTELPLKSYTTNVPNSAIPGFSAVSDFKYEASTFTGSGITPGAVAGFPAGGR